MTTLDQARLVAIIEAQCEIVTGVLDADVAMSALAEQALGLTGAEASVVEVADGDELVYHVATGAARVFLGMRLSAGASLSGRCLSEGRILHCHDATQDGRVDLEISRRLGAMSMICVPLRCADSTAVLNVYSSEPGAFGDDDIATLELLCTPSAAHIAHARAFERSRRESREDPLTGLGNRRAFEEELRSALALSARAERPLALCALDLDAFKQVNDRHGHPAGDALLAAVASVLRHGRAGDRPFRIGGDEFAVIMPDATLAGARIAGERIARAIATTPIDGVRAAVSVGVAERRVDDGPRELLARADAALYERKAGGRGTPGPGRRAG
jgi:diguanylate cyclase (GGDEF)-like protein